MQFDVNLISHLSLLLFVHRRLFYCMTFDLFRSSFHSNFHQTWFHLFLLMIDLPSFSLFSKQFLSTFLAWNIWVDYILIDVLSFFDSLCDSIDFMWSCISYLYHVLPLILIQQSIAYIPLFMYLSGFLSSFLMKYINAKIGKKVSPSLCFKLCLIIFLLHTLSLSLNHFKHYTCFHSFICPLVMLLSPFLSWIYQKNYSSCFWLRKIEGFQKTFPFQDKHLPVILQSWGRLDRFLIFDKRLPMTQSIT